MVNLKARATKLEKGMGRISSRLEGVKHVLQRVQGYQEERIKKSHDQALIQGQGDFRIKNGGSTLYKGSFKRIRKAKGGATCTLFYSFKWGRRIWRR